MERRQNLLYGIEREMRVLELGPGASPVVPKAKGWDAWSIDHASREELVQKYRPDPNVKEWRIEEVDVVWRDGSLDQAVPPEQHGTFDACIASHVLEHVPDPIGLFRSLERLLTRSGVISLAVPDKRFCFDFFKPISTVGELLEAHRRHPVRHSHKTRFDHSAYSINSAGQHCWHRRPVTELAFFESLEAAKVGFDSYGDGPDDPYVDCHAWHFTPSSFQLAVLELGALGEIDFSIAHSFPTVGCEFYVTLRRGRPAVIDGGALQAERLELLRRTLLEIREQTDYLLGRVDRVRPPAKAKRRPSWGRRLRRAPAVRAVWAHTPQPVRDRVRPAARRLLG